MTTTGMESDPGPGPDLEPRDDAGSWVPASDDVGGAADDGATLFARIRGVVGDGHAFRFVSEARRHVYLAILHCLLRRRFAHEVEVYHDDLRDEVAEIVRDLFAFEYEPLQFRSDIEQLGRWGNVTERVEPTRIRSLADRGRSKLLLRIEPSTVAFLEFLEAQADPVPLGIRDQGANLLADIHTSLKEAVAVLESARRRVAPAEGRPVPRAGEEEAFGEELLRVSYLVHEADAKTDRVAGELVRFGDLLARFVTEPFRVTELSAIGSWLERYVDRYLTVLDERSRAVRLALGRLAGDELGALLHEAERIERARLSATPGVLAASVRLRRASAVLASLREFFDPSLGLASQCRRLNRRTRDVIRRIQRHVESVRLRNVRTEMIRARIAELFAFADGPDSDSRAIAFVEGLVAAVAMPSDARAGTSDSKSAPPRPARRYESLRAAFRGSPLERKQSDPTESRALERLRFEQLSRFVETRILRGRPSAPISDAQLDDIADGRLVVRALAAYTLQGGRARKFLAYTMARAAGSDRAVIVAPDHELDLPQIHVERKA